MSSFLILGFAAALALNAPAPQADASLDAYAKPGTLVDIGGRKLNLRCTGSGAQTVVLENGAITDSMTWHKVQPQVAKFARVCAYDRAGFGFSDGGPLPRDIAAEAADLQALLDAAKIPTPIVLVGHSRGTNIARLFAQKHPHEVAALVLLDPPPQHIAEFSPEVAKVDEEQTTAGMPQLRKCEAAAERGELDSPKPNGPQCLRGPDPHYSAQLNAAQRAAKARPAFWHTLISVFETNIPLYNEPVSPQESHGAIPLLVLQPDTPFDDAPPEVRKTLEAARQKTQKQIAATSSRGEIIAVAHSTHDVQIDRPDAVVVAIRKALAATRSAR